MDKVKLTHSYSAVKLYENCPLRYYRQRVVCDIVDEGGEASHYGVRIHELLEKRLQESTPLPQEIQQYEPLCASVERLATGGELFVEHQLSLTEELTPTEWDVPDAWLRSILDILVIKGKVAVVMDWKTGKRRPDMFQMELFAVQVFKHFPEVQVVKATLVWLKDMKMDSSIYTRDQSNELWAGIMARIRRIHQSLDNNVWPAKPSGLCRYCPARHDCDFALV